MLYHHQLHHPEPEIYLEGEIGASIRRERERGWRDERDDGKGGGERESEGLKGGGGDGEGEMEREDRWKTGRGEREERASLTH